MERPLELNFWIVVIVCAVGVLQLIHLSLPPRKRLALTAFLAWWLAWLFLLASWALIRGGPLLGDATLRVQLLLSDLNSLLLIFGFFVVVYLHHFEAKVTGAFAVALMLLVFLGAFYLLVYFYFDNSLRLLQLWGLCLAAATPVLFGWALGIAYGGWLPVIVGLAYGFLQPGAFAAVIDPIQYTESTNPWASLLVLLAVMKVAWAAVVGRYLLQDPDTVPAPYPDRAVGLAFFGHKLYLVIFVALVVATLLALGRLGMLNMAFVKDLALYVTAIAAFLGIVRFLQERFDPPASGEG